MSNEPVSVSQPKAALEQNRLKRKAQFNADEARKPPEESLFARIDVDFANQTEDFCIQTEAIHNWNFI